MKLFAPKTVTLELTKQDAFTMFAFLSRYVYDGKLEINNQEEQETLRELCQLLDNELVEEFRADYRKYVEQNRNNKP